MPAWLQGWPNPENSKILERLNLLLKTLTTKGILVSPVTGNVPHLWFYLHGTWKIPTGRGQMCSSERQKTKLEYNPPMGPKETSFVNPCKNPRGPRLPDTPLMLFLSKMSGEFLNPWGSLVQVSCPLYPFTASCH